MANYKRVFIDHQSYFFTVVTYKRNPILIINIDLLRESFKFAKSKFDFIIEAIAIMPDHFHMILNIKEAKEYPKVIGTIKRYFSQKCQPCFYEHLSQSQSRKNQNYKPIWQKRYYEHTIRDERDFKIRLDYIHYNPVKHNLVSCVRDWKHSSFHRCVKMGWYDENWGNFDEKIDFE